MPSATRPEALAGDCLLKLSQVPLRARHLTRVALEAKQGVVQQ